LTTKIMKAMKAATSARLNDAEATLAQASALADAGPIAAAVLAVVAAELAGTAPAAGDADGPVELRLAMRCLARARAAVPPPPPPPDDALLIGPDAAWFRAPGGDRVSLERRRPLARILRRLAEERCQRAGASLGWDALLAAAWPGERVIPSAGAHRVRVALSTLRKLGLRDLIRTGEDGYLLAPDVPVMFVDGPLPSPPVGAGRE